MLWVLFSWSCSWNIFFEDPLASILECQAMKSLSLVLMSAFWFGGLYLQSCSLDVKVNVHKDSRKLFAIHLNFIAFCTGWFWCMLALLTWFFFSFKLWPDLSVLEFESVPHVAPVHTYLRLGLIFHPSFPLKVIQLFPRIIEMINWK